MSGILFLVHLGASVVLAAYGWHRFTLARRFVRSAKIRAPRSTVLSGNYPAVTVQIPLYNERYVAERAIRAAASLDYPSARLDIQVLDDSNDETCDMVDHLVRKLRREGVRVVHLRRRKRDGFKAGALAHGLQRATGELIAVFDADFVPPADFLRRLVGEFQDPGVGMVQARWSHLNRNASLLTKVQALQLDAHFTIEHGVRSATGCFFNFNGTAGIWRRRAIEDAGGWCADTLTEDLDLSYRAQLAGWRFVYRDDVEAPSELPVEVAAYRLQQQRWAQGGIQTAFKILPRIAQSQLPAHIKEEAVWHLTGHLAYPFLILLAASGVAAGWLTGSSYRPWLILINGGLLTFASISLTFFYGVAAWARGEERWWRRLALVPAIFLLGAGIAQGQARAVVRGILRQPTPFRRTPKYRQRGAGDTAWRVSSYRISTLGAGLGDCAAGTAILCIGVLAIVGGAIVPVGSIVLFGVGLLSTGCLAVVQHTSGHDTPTQTRFDPSPEATVLTDRCA